MKYNTRKLKKLRKKNYITFLTIFIYFMQRSRRALP